MYNKVHRLGQHACVGYEPTRGSVMIDGGELCHDDHQAFDNVAGLDETDNHTSGNLKMRHLQSADSDLTDVRLTQKGKWEFAKEITIMLIYLFFSCQKIEEEEKGGIIALSGLHPSNL